MHLRKPLIPLLCLLAFTMVAQNRLKPYEEYIAKYADIAVRQQKKHGVPASITMAQGLLESGAGKSTLAIRSNNHFGIKCHNTWDGDTVIFFDDGQNTCFRKYKKVEDSYDDHSMFLVRGKRYATLFMLDVNDYKSWAFGLKAAGYATDPSYAEKLIRIIETYDLNKLTSEKYENHVAEEPTAGEEIKLTRKELKAKERALRLSESQRIADAQTAEKRRIANEKRQLKLAKDSISRLEKAQRKAEKQARRLLKDSIAGTYRISTNEALQNVKDYRALPVRKAAQTVNPRSVHEVLYLGTTPYVKAQYGDSFESLAEEFGLTPTRIRKINEYPLNYALKSGENVFLDAKENWWEGENPYHVVQAGESMHSIAQKYGLKLDALYKMNNLTPGSAPKVGMRIKLRNPEQMPLIIRAINESMNKTDSIKSNNSTK
jgi:LysM repeat protein